MTPSPGSPDVPGADAAGESGAYVTTVFWYAPAPGGLRPSCDPVEPDPHVSAHPTLDLAERQGRQWGCMAGVRRVEVRSPDGTVQALWDKESLVVTKRRRYVVDGRMRYDVERVSNRWQRLGAESQLLHLERMAEILDSRATA